MDTVGLAAGSRLILVVLLVFAPVQLAAQSRALAADKTSEIKSLYHDGRWEAVVQAIPESPDEPAHLLLYRGLALSQLKRWSEAKDSFEIGLKKHPRDVPLMVELAGVDYHDKDYAGAKTLLRRALSIEPADEYADNFLASIYYLQGNLEAALEYWNRVGKPRIANLNYSPEPALNSLILDRAFDFSRGEVWMRSQYLWTQIQLKSLDLFPTMQFDLQPRPNDSFELTFRAPERAPWTRHYLVSVATMLRGLPFETVYPNFYNLDNSALNVRSSLRWDDQKRRITAELAGPFFDNPAIRSSLYFDARDENWNVTDTIVPAAAANARFNLERLAAGAQLRFLESGRWQWTLGAEYADHLYRSLVGIPAQAAPFFTGGSSIGLLSSVQRTLIRFPERRFTLESGAWADAGTFFEKPLGRYGRLQSSLAADWFPRPQGDDLRFQARLRAGATFGQVPLDDLFVLGFDRDTDLWMRGYPALSHGQKGNAPLGRDYILSNFDFDKIVYDNPFFAASIGPFFDSGKAFDSSAYFGSRDWMWDSGLQTKISVFGRTQIVLGWGITLRSGSSSFFATISP